ncbi:MAG: ACT domain-containing protein, partial [Promicromonosporaceae bacterium]|nr:ACT domain-containing protein [Promicromonosporaceae bacterium]
GVSVHREDCANVEPLRRQPERFVDVEWTTGSLASFLVQVQVEALDRAGLLSDITRVLTDNHINILSATVSTTPDRIALGKYVFEMAEPQHLANVLSALRKIDGVFDVHRITGAKGE